MEPCRILGATPHESRLESQSKAVARKRLQRVHTMLRTWFTIADNQVSVSSDLQYCRAFHDGVRAQHVHIIPSTLSITADDQVSVSCDLRYCRAFHDGVRAQHVHIMPSTLSITADDQVRFSCSKDFNLGTFQAIYSTAEPAMMRLKCTPEVPQTKQLQHGGISCRARF